MKDKVRKDEAAIFKERIYGELNNFALAEFMKT